MKFVTDLYVSSQLKFWQQQKAQMEADGRRDGEGLMPFIVISREYGCGGAEVGNAVAKILNEELKIKPGWAVYDRQIMDELSQDLGFSSDLAATLAFDTRNLVTEFFRFAFSNLPSSVKVYQKLTEFIRMLAIKGHVIIIGRGGTMITRDMVSGLQVKLMAPPEWRIRNLVKKYHMKREVAAKTIKQKDSSGEDVYSRVFKFDIMHPNNYHIIINCARFTAVEAARLIVEALKISGLLKI